jgi:hypothetical protein
VGTLVTPDVANPGFGFFCTASRISFNLMLTAAHCVTDETNGSLLPGVVGSRVYFDGPGGSFPGYNVSSVMVRPDWRGFDTEATAADGQLGKDMAILKFDNGLPSWVTSYTLYSGDPLFQETTNVGFGTHGNGVTGGVDFDLRRRAGNNRVDYYTNDPASSDWNILYTDFDDGTVKHDSFCFFSVVVIGSTVLCNQGLGNVEAGTAPGDSGGPLFINGQLAAVTSFGTYFRQTLADPNVPDGFGAINGFVGVEGNRGFIATAVPEPTTVVLFGGGLLLLGGVARRRRA